MEENVQEAPVSNSTFPAEDKMPSENGFISNVPKPINDKDKVYTKNTIYAATFIGGPIVGTYLIFKNFKLFGKNDAAKKTLFYGLLGTFLLFLTAVLLSEFVTNNLIVFFAFIPLGIVLSIVQTYQSYDIKQYLNSGIKQANFLGVFLKSLISLLISITFILLMTFIVTMLNVKFNYINYLTHYCGSTYKESLIKANSKEYIPEDASCFVASKLKKNGYTLNQVDEVLTLEFEYQKSIGLVDDIRQTKVGDSQAYEPPPYIKQHQKLNLNDSQINEILRVEQEYLRLIGVIVNRRTY